MKKILTGSVISVVTLLMTTGVVFAGGSSGTTTISGNGGGSTNVVVSKNKSKTILAQTNVSTFNNGVTTGTNTGHNHANNNTGGDVTLTSGNATTTTTITNVAGSNVSDPSVACCCSLPSVGDVTITGNGSDSTNKVIQKTKCVTDVTQTNVTNISNGVVTSTNTGNNHANGNTGPGNVSVTSGDSNTTVTISNVAGSNTN